MKRLLVPMLLLCGTAPAALAADVGVSIEFSQPGTYGRVDIGRYPQPQLILSSPVIVQPPSMPPPRPPEPLYLWVPPEHQQHWKEHCREYHACSQPVYFVHHDWYREHVLKEHRRDEGRGNERGHGYDRGHEEEYGRGKGRDHEDRDQEDHDRGRGRD